MSTPTLERVSSRHSAWDDYEYEPSSEETPRAEVQGSEIQVLADELEEFASTQGSIRQSMLHPNYGVLLAIGDPAVPHIVARLEHSLARPVLLKLLSDLTGLRMSLGTETVDDAARAWMTFGRRRSTFESFSR